MKKRNNIFEIEKLRNSLYVFKDRKEAGNILAKLIKTNKDFKLPAIVLAVPAGGVPVGIEVSKNLAIPFDVIVVKKIQLPNNTEAGFGSVGPDGEVLLNYDLIKKLRLSMESVNYQIEKTKKSVSERIKKLRGEKPFPDIAGHAVIIVDDGLASGYTMKEAIKFVKNKNPGEIIVAVPTAPLDTILSLIDDINELYCPNIRDYYPFAVADAYRNWYDLTEDDVMSMLKESK